MKKNYFIAWLLIAVDIFYSFTAVCQQQDCSFKGPVVIIDFGNDAGNSSLNVGSYANYAMSKQSCPDDGNYTFTSAVSGNCFNENWTDLPEDHTPGDDRGRMMLVNASYNAGTFFTHRITNLKAGITYEVAAWLINVCSGNLGCSPHPPMLSFTVLSTSGLKLGRFKTGQLWPSKSPSWQRYYALFTMPPNETSITLSIADEAEGGCGNDFALDDITLRECRLSETPKPLQKPVIEVIPVVNKSVTKKSTPNPVKTNATNTTSPPLKKSVLIAKAIANVDKTPVSKTALQTTATIKKNDLAVPEVLRTRSNNVVKKIEVTAREMLIELYDNGEIDGDTVTVFHNNQLMISNAGLSTKPVSFKITLDAQHPHHELVMVANNLGSIPPNTSLMVVTAGSKRYEVFISSTEKQNAAVIFDLKE